MVLQSKCWPLNKSAIEFAAHYLSHTQSQKSPFQVAYVPSFRYVCAKLCHMMCCRCRVTQDGRTFRDLLLSRWERSG